MGMFYGQTGTIIQPGHVNGVYTTGGTILSQGYDTRGFSVTFRHDLSGCGSPDSGIFVELKDFIPWTMMSVEFLVLGQAACWSFNTSGYGNAVGNSGTGNIDTYNEALGDRCVKTYLAQDEPAYLTHNKVYACDNNADNFMRFNTGVYRKCTFVRRRNINGSLAGPHHGRSCNSTGAGSLTIIQNIVVW